MAESALMSLVPGARLGPYEIVAPLGSGGMGEVWRAHDTKLGRDVALKILPELFAHDVDRLTRFQREARVLASLNHPNIAIIHGLEDANGLRALVLELVEGPTLAGARANKIVEYRHTRFAASAISGLFCRRHFKVTGSCDTLAGGEG